MSDGDIRVCRSEVLVIEEWHPVELKDLSDEELERLEQEVRDEVHRRPW